MIPDETLFTAHLTATELKQELAVLLFEQDRLTYNGPQFSDTNFKVVFGEI